MMDRLRQHASYRPPFDVAAAATAASSPPPPAPAPASSACIHSGGSPLSFRAIWSSRNARTASAVARASSANGGIGRCPLGCSWELRTPSPSAKSSRRTLACGRVGRGAGWWNQRQRGQRSNRRRMQQVCDAHRRHERVLFPEHVEAVEAQGHAARAEELRDLVRPPT